MEYRTHGEREATLTLEQLNAAIAQLEETLKLREKMTETIQSLLGSAQWLKDVVMEPGQKVSDEVQAHVDNIKVRQAELAHAHEMMATRKKSPKEELTDWTCKRMDWPSVFYPEPTQDVVVQMNGIKTSVQLEEQPIGTLRRLYHEAETGSTTMYLHLYRDSIIAEYFKRCGEKNDPFAVTVTVNFKVVPCVPAAMVEKGNTDGH